MKKITTINTQFSFAFLIIISWFVAACGGNSGDSPPPLTGRLIDSPVEGVNYSTSSGISGITDSEGRFNYLSGDTITFSLPPFTLGSVIGAEQITVLDLADAPQPSQRELEAIARNTASRTDRIRLITKALNTAILLQSLDEDGNPDNGITITTEKRAAFSATVRKLNLDWSTHSFINNLLKIYAETNIESQYSTFATTIRHLVDNGVITTPFYALTSSTYDNENDGMLESVTTYSYDSNGYNTRIEYDNNADGITDLRHTITYDHLGRDVHQETDFENDGSADYITIHKYSKNYSVERSTDNDGDGIFDEIRTSVYNNQGFIALRASDSDGNGIPEYVSTFDYDSYGNNILNEVDANNDGIIDYVANITYRNPTTRHNALFESDTDFDGAIDLVTFHSYDANDNLTHSQMDNDGDGVYDADIYFHYSSNRCAELIIRYNTLNTPHSFTTSRYNDNCDLLETRSETMSDGTLMYVHKYSYDKNGNNIRFTVDNDGDGDFDQIIWNEYDINGYLILTEVDTNGDEVSEFRHLYTYDLYGNRVRQEIRYETDDVADSVLTLTYTQIPNYTAPLLIYADTLTQ